MPALDQRALMRSPLEVLFVPHVGHGTFVAAFIAGREGVLAAGDDVFRAHGQARLDLRGRGSFGAINKGR